MHYFEVSHSIGDLPNPAAVGAPHKNSYRFKDRGERSPICKAPTLYHHAFPVITTTIIYLNNFTSLPDILP
jgi:hypothetical protein